MTYLLVNEILNTYDNLAGVHSTISIIIMPHSEKEYEIIHIIGRLINNKGIIRLQELNIDGGININYFHRVGIYT